MLTAPLAAPPVAIGFLLLVFFTTNPLGRLADSLIGVVLSPTGIVVAQTAVVYPIALRLLWEVFDSLDPGYEEIARALGCKGLCLASKVLLPLAWKGVLSTYAVCFARAMGEFGATVVLAGATPEVGTLPVAIYLAFTEGDPELAIALSLVSILAATLLLILHAVAGGGGWRR
jgi:molybdate transport system permease protein